MAPFSASSGAVLALDTASPTVSVAVADPAAVLAERCEEIGRSSVRLLGMVDEVLAEAGTRLGDLAGIVVLAGPGSFTGLRVGMSTVLGFHLATGVPATAVPTLEVLAHLAPPGRSAVAAVDVLRGEWAAQSFGPGFADTRGDDPPPRARGEAARIAAGELVARVRDEEAVLIGFGVGVLGVEGAVEPTALAPAAALAAARRPPDWDPSRLAAPLYFRPPATTPAPPRR